MHRALRSVVVATIVVAWAGGFPVSAAEAEEEKEKDVAIVAIDEFIEKQQVDKSKSGWKTSLSKPPKVEFEADKTYYWNLDTNVGNMKIKLYPDVAPMHVSSTIYLTRLGFYDDLAFHRIIPRFMAQCGEGLPTEPLCSSHSTPSIQVEPCASVPA